MAFPLATVLAAAPGLISAATDIIRLIKQKKSSEPLPDKARLDELITLLEQQAQVIEELAVNNRNMAIAVRNNRILSLSALIVSMLVLGVLFLAK